MANVVKLGGSEPQPTSKPTKTPKQSNNGNGDQGGLLQNRKFQIGIIITAILAVTITLLFVFKGSGDTVNKSESEIRAQQSALEDAEIAQKEKNRSATPGAQPAGAGHATD